MPKLDSRQGSARGRLSVRTLCVAVCVAIAVAPAVGQTAPGKAAGKGPYEIAGTVLNALTGAPLQRATVAALAESDSHIVESAVCDNDGHFALSGLGAAKYQLTASKRGFRAGFYDQHDEFSSAIVTGPEQDTEHLTFRLTPNALLHGLVTGDGGDPVEGARVMLFLLPRSGGREGVPAHGAQNEIEEVDSVTTDDTGAYEFGNLDAGTYAVAVTAEPWYALHRSAAASRRDNEDEATSEMGAALDVAYPVTYYDSTTDESSATPLALAAGSREEADINLHAVPALNLSVAVPRKQGGSIARPELRQLIFGMQISAESTGLLDALQTGSAEFTGVAPGHYILLQGDPPRTADVNATASEQIDAAAGAPTVSITGTLRTASGRAVPEEVNLLLYLTNSPLHLAPLQATALRGQFRFRDVPAGEWELDAWSGGEPVAILSTVANGASHAGGRLTVADRAVTIAATVAAGDARVEGFVRKNGKDMAGALVVLAPRIPDNFDGLVRRDQSDSDGSFSLRDVAPGQYTLVAIENAWDLDHAGADALARYLPGGIAVTVSTHGGTVLQLPRPVDVQPH